MAILTERVEWRRQRPTKPHGFKLTDDESAHVRRAARFLLIQVGSLRAVARALGVSLYMVERATSTRSRRRQSAGMAIAVARAIKMPVEALLAGEAIPGPCPVCGRVTGGV